MLVLFSFDDMDYFIKDVKFINIFIFRFFARFFSYFLNFNNLKKNGETEIMFFSELL